MPYMIALEVYAAICALEKANDRIDFLTIKSNTPLDANYDFFNTPKGKIDISVKPFYSIETGQRYKHYEITLNAEKISQLCAFGSKTLKQTVQEIRSSGTFNTLLRTKDSILETLQDYRRLENEWTSKLKELRVLQEEKKRQKIRYNVSNRYIQIILPRVYFFFFNEIVFF